MGAEATGGWIRGVDGCKGGWLAVSLAAPGAEPAACIHGSAGDLFAQSFNVTAIDIPIGLRPAGTRTCDNKAREILGDRRSSVFSAPVRAVLSHSNYAEANACSRAVDGRGLSQQSFALVPKIAEVDLCLRKRVELREVVYEVHPELSFALWNGGRPMRYPKRSGFGFLERLTLTQSRFPCAAERIRKELPSTRLADDDILDALAALWTAERIATKQAVRMDDTEAFDAEGLAMNIRA